MTYDSLTSHDMSSVMPWEQDAYSLSIALMSIRFDPMTHFEWQPPHLPNEVEMHKEIYIEMQEEK